MLVSIVTVSFNSRATIADTLHSVAEQRYPDIEHIVVDGASTDGTLEVIRANGSRVARVISEPDKGIYDAMNKGWRIASGDVVGYLNSDDVFDSPDSVGHIAAAFRDDVDACYGDLVYVRRADPSKVVRYWRSRSFANGDFRKGWQPPHPTFYVRRAVLARCGGFDLEFRIQSDFELCLRLLEVERIRTCYIPRVLVRMRTGGVSNAGIRNVLKGNIEAYRACRKNGLDVPPSFMLRKVMSRLPQFVTRPVG